MASAREGLQELCSRHGIDLLYVFGSRAAEIAGAAAGNPVASTAPGSDVDIGIPPHAGAQIDVRQKSVIAVELEELFGVGRATSPRSRGKGSPSWRGSESIEDLAQGLPGPLACVDRMVDQVRQLPLSTQREFTADIRNVLSAESCLRRAPCSRSLPAAATGWCTATTKFRRTSSTRYAARR